MVREPVAPMSPRARSLAEESPISDEDRYGEERSSPLTKLPEEEKAVPDDDDTSAFIQFANLSAEIVRLINQTWIGFKCVVPDSDHIANSRLPRSGSF